jgi:hypothetical protein
MTVTFVTALVLPPGPMFRPIDHYFKHFETLANTGVQIVAYIDSRLTMEHSYSNVLVVPTEPIFSDRVFTLPYERNATKDTAEYMQIQLMKLKFLSETSTRTDADFLAWIDFAVFAIFKDPQRCAQRIRELSLSTYRQDKILIPGCWSNRVHNLWYNICWRYCGGFMIGHRSLFERAYQRQAELFKANLPRITWEVNYWVLMSDCFQWYQADHDDSILDARNIS